MLDNYKTLPFIIGVGLILIFPIVIGTIAVSVVQNDSEGQETTESATEENSSNVWTGKQNIEITPVPPTDNRGSGVGYDSSQGIPIGKYSNPPTRIETFEEYDSEIDRSPNSPGSSVEFNRLQQNNLDGDLPNYSAPSSSNNFKSGEDNSLTDSLSPDTLEVPQSDLDEESELEIPPLSPLTQPLGDRSY